MKKILLLSTLITTIWAGNIGLNGVIVPAAIVGFDTPITESLVDNSFTFKGYDIDIGSIPLDSKIAAVSKDIYVNTNSASGVTMEIEDNVNPHPFLAGHLIDGSGTNLVAMKYSLMGSSYAIANHPTVDLVTAVNDGSATIGTFVVEQKNKTSSDQPSGIYSAVFDVTIAAK